MTDENVKGLEQPNQSGKAREENSEETVLPVHNPLDPADKRHLTQEDIENEQRFKEALTERD